MNGINGILLAKNGAVYLKKKPVAVRSDDPEFEAEIRYAKENGLEAPRAPEPAKPVEINPRALSQRNRSKSTSDVKASSPPKVKSTKAERKARNRAVSGCWGKKDGNKFEYGLADWDEFNEDYAADDYDDTVVDDGDEYEDVIFKFDIKKVQDSLVEYFNSADVNATNGELNEYLYNQDSICRVTKELLTQSLDLDHCRVALGYRLLIELLKTKNINEKAIYATFEEVLADLENLVTDMPRARENLSLFIAKTVNDKIIPRIVFDQIANKTEDSRLATSCVLEVYFYLSNASLLNGKFDSSGSFEPLDVLDRQMEKILIEFIVSGDCEEVGRCLNDLHAQHYNHEFLYLVGYHAINKMNEQLMDKLSKLLKHLIDTGCLLRSSLKFGFERLFKSLNDLYIDLPAAFSLCDLFVKKCQSQGFLDDSIVSACPKPSGKRARTLSESDENGKIFVLDDTPQKNGV